MSGKNHKDLLVWQKAMQATQEIYTVVRRLPKEEMYALADQMRRAAVSLPSNIAEGNARCTEKEAKHFLYIAQGSRAELETQLELCVKVGYLTENEITNLMNLLQEIGRMLQGLIKHLTSNI